MRRQPAPRGDGPRRRARALRHTVARRAPPRAVVLVAHGALRHSQARQPKGPLDDHLFSDPNGLPMTGQRTRPCVKSRSTFVRRQVRSGGAQRLETERAYPSVRMIVCSGPATRSATAASRASRPQPSSRPPLATDPQTPSTSGVSIPGARCARSCRRKSFDSSSTRSRVASVRMTSTERRLFETQACYEGETPGASISSRSTRRSSWSSGNLSLKVTNGALLAFSSASR